jgi:hypothetical protein
MVARWSHKHMSTCYTHDTLFMISTPSTTLTDKLHNMMNFLVLIYWYKVINLRNVLPLVNVCCSRLTSYRLFYCSTTLHNLNCNVLLAVNHTICIIKNTQWGKPACWPVSSLVPCHILKHRLKIIYLPTYIYVYIDTI